MIIQLVILIVLILLSAFFSGTETAFMSLGKFKYKEYIRKKKKNWKLVKQLKEDPHKLISTILVGNNLMNIGAGSLATLMGTKLFLQWGYQFSEATAAGIITGVLTLFILVFGEIIPKTYANMNYEKVISISAGVIYILSIVLTPMVMLLDIASKGLTRGKIANKDEESITEEEIKTIVNVGSDEGGINKYEKQLIHKIFQFDDKIVKEIMTPRVKVYSLDSKLKIKNVLKNVLNKGYSRVPVFKDNPDNIIGVFHIRDILQSLERKKLEKTVQSIASKPMFVPESKPIDDLFKEMQRRKKQMAVVVDEFGGVAGILTMEDLLEEIVGEIYDEDEERVNVIKKISDREYLIRGETTLRDIKETIKINIEGLDSETIGSYILDKMGKIPNKREIVRLKRGKLIVEKVTDKNIESVRIKL